MPPEAESREVIDAILTPAETPAGEAGGEEAARPDSAPARGTDGRFAPADLPEDGEDDTAEAPAEDEAPEEAAAEEDQPEEEQPEEAPEEAPQNLDEFTVEVVVDGKPAEVSLGELKREYSANKYIQKNIQQAVEYRQASFTAASQAHSVLEQQVQHLEAISNVWRQFAAPQVDLERLKATDPQAYALKRVELIDAQERVQKIEQEIHSRRQQQAALVAEARARRVEDETRELLRKLPALADPQKAPVVMGKIREVAQSYGVSDDELGELDGHVPFMVLAELAWRREQMAQTEARLKRPTGNQPRPKTLIRPGMSQPAKSPAKRLDAEIINRARKSGKPDDVAATLLVPRKRA